MKATYTGEGGYPADKAEANDVLTKGTEYEIESAAVGSFRSTIKLKGIAGNFNTALFDGAEVDDLLSHDCDIPVDSNLYYGSGN